MLPGIGQHLATGQGIEAPIYHSAMLEVRFRTDFGPLAAAATMGVGVGLTRSVAAASEGLGALMSYERSGLIRRVTPLSEAGGAPIAASETPMLSAFSASVSPRLAVDPNRGATIVELYEDAAVDSLQAELMHDPAVASVSRVPVRYLLAKKIARRSTGAAPAAAPPPTSSLWNLTKIRWAQARSAATFVDADQIKVAVLDTGIDTAHPDLAGAIASYEYSHPQNPANSSSRDIIGHGTHVAGTIAAAINNAVGINGICRCQLHAMKIFDDGPDWHSGYGYFVYFVDPVMYLRALSHCLTLGVDVINLSIGGAGAPSAQESQLFATLIQSGTVIVAAMGNSNSCIPEYPAAIPGVIAVGATSINDRRATFSNKGSHIAVSAPGESIWSTLPTYAGNTGYRPRPTWPPTPDLSQPLARDTDYAAWSGTSMASPHVAGAAALLRAKHGALPAADVRQRLEATSDKVPWMQGQTFSKEYGHGRLNLEALLS